MLYEPEVALADEGDEQVDDIPPELEIEAAKEYERLMGENPVDNNSDPLTGPEGLAFEEEDDEYISDEEIIEALDDYEKNRE